MNDTEIQQFLLGLMLCTKHRRIARSMDQAASFLIRKHLDLLSMFKRKIRTHLDILSIPQLGGKMSKRLGWIKGCKYKTPSWYLNGFPDGNNLGCCCTTILLVFDITKYSIGC